MTIKELRGFLGLSCDLRRFILNYGKISTPLTKLLKKEVSKWTEEIVAAF